MILTSDWHLDDNPDNFYRWFVFDSLKAQLEQGETRFVMLGDLCDKKDRHSAELVNQLLDAFSDLCQHAYNFTAQFEFIILCGNHDLPLRGAPYWNLLNYLGQPYQFLTEPTLIGAKLFLPYSHDPACDWNNLFFGQSKLDFSQIKTIFMHQTLTGARAEGSGHRVMEGKPGIPLFPAHVKVYSGDIHLPQTIKWGCDVEYVGAPHLVRFGDDHPMRLLRLDETSYEIAEEILLEPPGKMVVAVSSIAELRACPAKAGDQVRVRFTIPHDKIEQWGIEEAEVKRWAAELGVDLASIEPIIERYANDEQDRPVDTFNYDPLALLEQFAATEGLDQGLFEAGRALLAGARE